MAAPITTAIVVSIALEVIAVTAAIFVAYLLLSSLLVGSIGLDTGRTYAARLLAV